MRRLFLPLLFVLTSSLSPLLAQAPIVFCSYNVENYNDGRPPGESSKFGTRPKSAEAIEALVKIVASIRPDVLGVCEMGPKEKLADFQSRLKAAGLDYPETELVQAMDEDRHLALLSRFPIVARQSQSDVPFQLNGQTERVRRGFLDVTIEVNSEYRLRCVGVHLKSKLPTPQGEALVRRMEAEKLREHLDQILTKDPEANVICYGDFNDTKNEPMFQKVIGPKGSPQALTDLWCRDPLGDRWTHYWRTADLYSRIDYLFVSQSLYPEVLREKSAIYRGDNWNEASDHRPIYTTIVPVNKARR